MIEASCHCGAVRMRIAAPPETVNDCRCSICRRLGALWAYYSSSEVHLEAEPDATFIYLWNHRIIEFHTCRTCGCTTHWAPVDKTYDRMGVNARLMAPAVLAAARMVSEGPP